MTSKNSNYSVSGNSFSSGTGPLNAKVYDVAGRDLAELLAEYEAFLDQPAPSNASRLGFASSNKTIATHDDYVVIEAVALDGNGARLLRELEQYGLTQGGSYENAVSGLLPIAELANLPAVANLSFAAPSYAKTNVGSVDNQADIAIDTDAVRATFGVDGTGVTIGILSDSFDAAVGQGNATISYADDIASGDLPGDVNIVEDLFNDPSVIDEGRAMAQLIHDLAPGASLAFATAFTGQAAFAQNIGILAAFSDVVVDDIFYFAEPFFQDGIITQAVDAAFAAGTQYYSSAGNSSNASYEADFVAEAGVVAGQSGTYHDFDPGAGVDLEQDFVLQPNESITLSFQWDEPYITGAPGSGGSASDIDLFLINTDTDTIIEAGLDGNVGRDPVEILSFENTTGSALNLALAIQVFSGPAPNVVKYIDFDESDGLMSAEFATLSGTSVGHASAEGGLGVGAAFYQQTPEFGVSPPELETFSSLGDTPILFDVAGNRLGTAEIRERVDITAPDGTDTTFFGQFGIDATPAPNFFGTSAAAPHAAALGALLLDANSALTPTQVYDALQNSAIDIVARENGDFVGVGYDNWSGHGLINAPAAFAEITLPNGPLVVDIATDENDGNTAAGDLSLREAIQIAQSTDQDITFDASLSGATLRLNASLGTLTITDGDFSINGNVDGDAFGIPDITISGDTGGNDTTTTDPLGFVVTNASANANAGDNVAVLNVSGAGTNVDFESLVITGGVAGSSGGGIHVEQSAFVSVNQSTVAGNTASSSGGGIHVDDAGLRVIDTTLAGNSSQLGGAIFSAANGPSQSTTISNSTISGNVATVAGAGVYASEGHTDISNATLVDNTAPDGAGVFSSDMVGTQTTVTSSIVAGGSSVLASNGGSTFVSGGNNLIGVDDDGFFTDGVNGDQVGTSLAPVNPLLAPLGNNGGPNATHLPQAGSPVIDAGANPDGLSTDQRGDTRVEGAGIDIGSVETVALPDLVVTDFSVSATNVPEGATVEFEWDVANVGEAASGSFDTGVYFSTDANVTTSDLFVGFLTTNNVGAPGSNQVQTASFALPNTITPGVYFVSAIADDLAVQTESDEANNASAPVQVIVGTPFAGPVILFDENTNEIARFQTIAEALAIAPEDGLIAVGPGYSAGPETVSTNLTSVNLDTPAGVTTTINLTGTQNQSVTEVGAGSLVVNANPFASGAVLNGNTGDDVLNASGGTSILNGNGGDDTLNAEFRLRDITDISRDTFAQNGASFTTSSGTVTFRLVETITLADVSFNGIFGVAINDTYTGTAQNDIIAAGSNADAQIAGEGGRDILLDGTGNSTIDGGLGDDILLGDGGNDDLIGGEGDDALDGGAGSDTAVYAGNRDGYLVTQLSNGSIEVEDINPGNGDDGTDTLTDIEVIAFADQLLDPGDLVAPPPPAPTSTILDRGNANIIIDGAISAFSDFGGTDTYTILGSLQNDVTITDADVSTVILPIGVEIDGARFLADGVQFDIDGRTVTLLGSPDSFTYVFAGSPLDPAAGVPQDYDTTAATFGTTVPAAGAPANEATITGIIQPDGFLVPAGAFSQVELVGGAARALDALQGFDTFS